MDAFRAYSAFYVLRRCGSFPAGRNYHRSVPSRQEGTTAELLFEKIGPLVESVPVQDSYVALPMLAFR